MRQDGQLGDLKLWTGRLEASLREDTLDFSNVIQDFLVWIVPPRFNTASGLGWFHNAGQADLGPVEYRV